MVTCCGMGDVIKKTECSYAQDALGFCMEYGICPKDLGAIIKACDARKYPEKYREICMAFNRLGDDAQQLLRDLAAQMKSEKLSIRQSIPESGVLFGYSPIKSPPTKAPVVKKSAVKAANGGKKAASPKKKK